MKTKIIFLVIAALFATTTSGQTPKLELLETRLSTHTNIDTAKVNLLNELAYEEFLRNPEKAKSYAQQSSKISSTLNYPKGKAASLWISGLVCMRENKQEALGFFREALKIAEQIEDKEGMCNYQTAIGNVTKDMGDIKTSDDAKEKALQLAMQLGDKQLIIKCRFNISINMKSSGKLINAAQQLQEVITLGEELDNKQVLAKAYSTLASIYQIQGNSSTALEYYLSALELNEKIEEAGSIFINFVSIAGVQFDQNEFDAALATINKALQLAQKQNDPMQISVCYTNIGNIYRKMNNPKALDYFQKSLSLSKNSNIGQRINNLMNIGAIYTTQKEFGKALQSLNEALELAQKANIKNVIGEVYVEMSKMHIAQKQYNPAKECIYKVQVLAKAIHYTALLKDCNKLLSDIAASTGNFHDAYIYYTQYKSLCDTLLNETNTRKIALLESSYKFARERRVFALEKASDELRIRNQHQIILLLIVVTLLVLWLTWVVYQSGQLRKKVLSLEIENMNKELEDNQKAMAVARLKLVQNAERDLHNIKMLEDIGNNTAAEGRSSVNSMISNYKSQANHSNWEEFETLFTKIHKSFWEELSKINPTLTPNERKLCAFLKLNMNNKDIALITFQSEDALKKSRLRLRKKFDLDRSTNLTTFIHNIAN